MNWRWFHRLVAIFMTFWIPGLHVLQGAISVVECWRVCKNVKYGEIMLECAVSVRKDEVVKSSQIMREIFSLSSRSESLSSSSTVPESLQPSYSWYTLKVINWGTCCWTPRWTRTQPHRMMEWAREKKVGKKQRSRVSIRTAQKKRNSFRFMQVRWIVDVELGGSGR